MNFFNKLINGKRSKEVDSPKSAINLPHQIQVKIKDETFLLVDNSENGFSCTREIPDDKALPFKKGEIKNADFFMQGYKKISANIEIRWCKSQSFEAKIVNMDKFQDFVGQYLVFVKDEH